MTVGTTRLVLVRHGEAVCNVAGVVGGRKGCTGLTPLGRAQASTLAERLARTGELGEVGAVYASVLPRAIETAEILTPALTVDDAAPLRIVTDCTLCELHPGEADALTWDQYVRRFEEPAWDTEPTTPIAPGGEGWSGFVARAAAALDRVAAAHSGQTVVVVTHAGVVEASILRFLPVDPASPRLGLHTLHTSLTVWQRVDTRDGGGDSGGDGGGDGAIAGRGPARRLGGTARPWLLERYNDVAR